MWLIKFEENNQVWAVWNTNNPSSRRIFTEYEEAYAYWMGTNVRVVGVA